MATIFRTKILLSHYIHFHGGKGDLGETLVHHTITILIITHIKCVDMVDYIKNNVEPSYFIFDVESVTFLHTNAVKANHRKMCKCQLCKWGCLNWVFIASFLVNVGALLQ